MLFLLRNKTCASADNVSSLFLLLHCNMNYQANFFITILKEKWMICYKNGIRLLLSDCHIHHTQQSTDINKIDNKYTKEAVYFITLYDNRIKYKNENYNMIIDWKQIFRWSYRVSIIGTIIKCEKQYNVRNSI